MNSAPAEKTKAPDLTKPYDISAAKAAGVIDAKTIKMQKSFDDSLKFLQQQIALYGDAAFASMSAGQLQLLDSRGIHPIVVTADTGGGGYGGGGYGGGGRGGSGGGSGGGARASYASNAGYTGLINWRL